jgi:hypothetical protein
MNAAGTIGTWSPRVLRCLVRTAAGRIEVLTTFPWLWLGKTLITCGERWKRFEMATEVTSTRGLDAQAKLRRAHPTDVSPVGPSGTSSRQSAAEASEVRLHTVMGRLHEVNDWTNCSLGYPKAG